MSGFIETKQQEYYVGWYFDSLQLDEKLALIKAMYAIHSMGIDYKKDYYFIQFEKDFCIESDNFFDYLKVGI